MNKMLLIDLETQKYYVESGIFEVACLAVEDYRIVGQLYIGKKIDAYKGENKYGYGFHNICQDSFSIKKFKNFIDRYPYPIVAHNCPFDKKFLLYYDWLTEEHLFYCSMRAIRLEVNSLESYALHYLVKHYRIAEDIEHTAMSDVMDLYQLLNVIRPQAWIPVATNYYRSLYQKTKPRALSEIDLPIGTTSILADENVCFTGKSEYPRHTMQEIAIINGAQITNNVTSKTTILVVGTDAGSKLDKAQKKEISILSDREFMEMLNLAGKDIGA